MVKHTPLNIMHVVYSLETGGLENGVVNLCNRLSPEKFAPSICIFRPGGALEARVNTEFVKLLVAKAYLGNDPTLPFRLARQLWRLQIDILHTHSWGTLVEGLTAAKMARIPLVIHGEHGVMEERPRNVLVQRWLWSKAHQITAVAAPLADKMANVIRFPRKRIQVIHNGVDTERFRPRKEIQSEFRRHFGLPLEGFLVGMVARLESVKNHFGMLRALSLLGQRGLKPILALAGSGSLLEHLQQAARDLNVHEQVYFLGDISQVECFFNALDIFVLNSLTEGMSNTILEAMASGLPVVATSVGSNHLLLDEGKTGYLIPIDDNEALALILEKLAREPLSRSAMGKNARWRVENQFSIDRMVRDYEELYLRKTAKHTVAK